MHLVDTSVWIHALRPSGSLAIRSLLKPLIVSGDAAISDWIMLELMTGLRSSEGKESLLRWFAPVASLRFDPSWWEEAWDIAACLRKRGVSPTAADCLIATLAIQHKAVIVHCDSDFEIMKPTIPLRTLDWTSYVSQR